MQFPKQYFSDRLTNSLVTKFFLSALAGAVINPVAANDLCQRYYSNVCEQKYSGNEHMLDVCNSFTANEIRCIRGEQNLNLIVDAASENTLLIIERESMPQSAPVKLTGRQSILPADASRDFKLIPASYYDTTGDPVFCQIKVGDGGSLGGFKADATTLSGVSDFNVSLQNPDKPVTLVYTHGASEFQIIRAQLKGAPGMDYVVWANNDVDRTDVAGGTYHRLVHSYIEANGASNAVSLELPVVEDSDNKELVYVENNMITTGGTYPAQGTPKALNIENGCGNVSRNHLSFADNTELESSQIRHLLFMKNVDGTTVSNTVFHSGQAEFREGDQLVNLHTTKEGAFTAHFNNNLGTGKATAVSGNVEQVYGSFTNNLITMNLPDLLTADDFFQGGALAGVWLIDRHTEQRNVMPVEQASWNNSISFTSRNAICPENSGGKYSTSSIASYVFNGIQGVANILLVAAVTHLCIRHQKLASSPFKKM